MRLERLALALGNGRCAVFFDFLDFRLNRACLPRSYRGRLFSRGSQDRAIQVAGITPREIGMRDGALRFAVTVAFQRPRRQRIGTWLGVAVGTLGGSGAGMGCRLSGCHQLTVGCGPMAFPWPMHGLEPWAFGCSLPFFRAGMGADREVISRGERACWHVASVTVDARLYERQVRRWGATGVDLGRDLFGALLKGALDKEAVRVMDEPPLARSAVCELLDGNRNGELPAHAAVSAAGVTWTSTSTSLVISTEAARAPSMSCGQYLTGMLDRRLISEAAECFTSMILATAPVPPRAMKMSSTVLMPTFTTCFVLVCQHDLC